MYKVFYNQRTVFFTDNDINYVEKDDSRIHFFKNREILQEELNQFVNSQELNSFYIINKDIEYAFKEFSSLFQIIEAAGGLVRNNNEEFLVIFRHDKWDLPKGKIEKEEQANFAAIREVEEECGISNLVIHKLLEITFHTYILNEKDILKKTYWYEMSYTGNENPKPQIEENITEAKWLKKRNYKEIINNTFPSIIEVLRKGEII